MKRSECKVASRAWTDIIHMTNMRDVQVMGDATIALAEANPEINYLGIEVHTPGVGKVLSEIKKRELKNLYIIELEYYHFLNYKLFFLNFFDIQLHLKNYFQSHLELL